MWKHTHVHTDEHEHMHRCMLLHKCTAWTIHDPSHKSFDACLIFSFPIFIFVPLHPTVGSLSIDPSDSPSIAVKQWTFHGSVPYCGNSPLYLQPFRNQWSPEFTSPITFPSPFLPLRLPTAEKQHTNNKKRTRKACATKRIYGYVCMATVAQSYQS